ncbi:MAG: CARDB domain-containing protein [Pseudolysinimonas sp.]
MRLASGAFAAVAALVGGLIFSAVAPPTTAQADPPTGGSVIVNESFTGATVPDTAWTGLGTTCLTGAPAASVPSPTINNCDSARAGPVPAIGVTPGYLQLTDASTFKVGSILYNRAIPASAGISVVFEQYQYGGNGADGIGFFLVDGATNLTVAGGNGGSLGYTQRSGVDGIRGGYIGVGLDVFGNFYADGEGKGQNCPAGQRAPSVGTGPIAPNVVTLRGPGSGRNGYCYQASTTNPASDPHKPTSTLPGSLRAPNGTTNPAVARRLVNVQVTPAPNARVIVQIDFGTGNGWQEVLNRPAPANAPSTYKFGFTGATGSVTDVHLLRNVVVQTIEPLTDLQITKQVDLSGVALPAVVSAGTTISYQYVVTNAGLEQVDTLSVSDDKIAAVTCAATTLPPAPDPAASTVCRGTYTVTPADVTSGSVTNVAQATAVDPGNATVTSNQDTATVPLVSRLTLTKSAVTAAPYAVGQQVTYNYTVTNSGGSTVSNIAVKDSRTAAGTVTCDRTNVDPGQVATCAMTTSVLAGQLAANGSLRNTALATGQTPLGQQVTSNQAQATIQVGTDVRVTKSVDDTAPLVGQQVTFTVTGTNDGPGLANDVVINDLLPTGLDLISATTSSGTYDSATGNWTIPTLPLGSPTQPATLTVVATVNTAAVITNAATLTALRQPDTNPANNTASVTLNPVVPTTDVAVNVFVDSPTVRVGQTAIFTISATNNGPQPATNVTVGDPLPSLLQFVSTDGAYDAATGVWTVGTLAVGQTVSVNVTVRATAVGSFQNTAGLATVSPQDVNQSNDVDSTNLAVTALLADLQLVKSISSGVDSITVGDFVTYSVTVTNAGPDTVADVIVAETRVPGLTIQIQDFSATNPTQGTVDPTDLTWSVGSLAPGASATIVVRVEVLTVGTKVNAATVSSASADDPDLSNNTDIASFGAGPTQLDVGVTKTRIGPGQVFLGRTVTFSIDVTNNGPAGATQVTVYDPLPAGLEYASSTATAGTFDPATALWTLAALPSGQTETLTLTATATAAGAATNTASLQSLDQADTDPANNSAAASVDVVVRADLSITKTVSPAVAQPGDTATYTVVVTNDGPNDAEDVQAVDPVRIEATLTSATASQGSFDVAARLWDVGTLASGDSATLSVTVLITRAGTYLNTVVISQSSVPDPDLADNQAYAVIEIPAADLRVTKSVDDNTPDVGQRVTFTISASNMGPDPTTSAAIDDMLPASLTYVSSVASTGAFDARTGRWSIGALIVNGPVETLTIVAQATSPGPAVNAAHIDSAFPFDPDQANNTASVALFMRGANSPNSLSMTGMSAVLTIIASAVLLGLGTVALLARRRRAWLD